ncbi:MAG: type II secretion system protein [Candidatus Paceibacterota bacterium]|jgi:prepilin-type N-terminal cleavage/methylation domain-containing protein
MKQNKGFTLIEMLVVVGMIGVLAGAVLGALGPSRNKARDARVISGLNQLAAIAETGFDGNNYPASIADLKLLSGATSVINDIKASMKDVEPTYNIGNASFAISSGLPSGGSWGSYCVDSAGKRMTGNRHSVIALNGECVEDR